MSASNNKCNEHSAKLKRTLRNLCAGLLLFCSATHAEQWLETKNDLGGRIVLLTTKCSDKYPTLLSMMATHPNGRTLYGCWTYFAGMVQVVYEDGSTYNYPPHIFTAREEK